MIEFDNFNERPWKYQEDEMDDYEGHSTDFESLIAITHPYDIDVNDLGKRASAMVCILNTPKANKRYNTNQAIHLMNKCAKTGRQDLVLIIREALSK
jgi:hypothetical protein